MFDQLLITDNVKEKLVQLITECAYIISKAELRTTNNQLVIGYGHIIKPSQTEQLKEITKDEAVVYLRQDLKQTYLEAARYWGMLLMDMGEWRMAAILDATYSCSNLLRWPKLTQAVFQQNWQQAAVQLLDSRYAHQVGVRVKRNAYMIMHNKGITVSQLQKLNNN